jgi:hypothetical protein
MNENNTLINMSNYRFTDEEQKQEDLPHRVKILIDDYIRAGKLVNPNLRLDYQLQTIDYHEKIFDNICSQKPKSLKIMVTSMYRVKTLQNEEFYFYAATKTCNPMLNQPAEPFSYEYYGYHKRPVVSVRWEESAQKAVPKITSYTQGYELKWDKEEVRRLLDSSSIPCTNFYVGSAGRTANDPIDDHPYQVFNTKDFLEGSIDDLIDLGRFGISHKEPSLYLIPSARKKERENREATVGMRDPRFYT